MRSRDVFLFVSSLVCMLFAGNANADCCPADAWGFCADGTRGTPYCGYGPCNIFGCNCDGGCRRPSGAMESVAPITTETEEYGAALVRDEREVLASTGADAEALACFEPATVGSGQG